MGGPESISDFYKSSFLRRHVTLTKSAMSEATRELATETKAARKIARAGNVSNIFGLDKDLARIERYRTATSIEAARLTSSQTVLETIKTLIQDVSLDVVDKGQMGSEQSMIIAASAAVTGLQTVVSNLNSSVAGQMMFAGDATNTSPLASHTDIIADVRALIAAAPDTATALADVDTYFFDAGGGFETSIYQGSTQDKLPVTVSSTMMIDANLRADDPVVRTALRNLAIIAVVGEGAMSGNLPAQMGLLKDAGLSGLETVTDVTRIQERFGYAQEQIERVDTRNEAERYLLMRHRNDLANADPYETATRLQSLEAQLESVFVLTARLSGLKLVNFIR